MLEQDLSLKTQFAQLKQYIPLVFPVIALGTVVLLLVKILLPETLSVKEKFEKIDEDKVKIFELEKKLAILNEFEKETLVDLISKSQILIPTSEDLASLLINLSSLAEKSGVNISNFDFEAVNLGSGGGVKFKITLVGGEEQLFNFFRLMEDPTKRILSIEEISLSVKGKQAFQEVGIYNVDLDILAPYSSFPQNVGGVKEAIPELSDSQREIIEQISMVMQETSTSESEAPAVDFEPRENPFTF